MMTRSYSRPEPPGKRTPHDHHDLMTLCLTRSRWMGTQTSGSSLRYSAAFPGSILQYSISAYLGGWAGVGCVADCPDPPDWARATAVGTMRVAANVIAKKILLAIIS